MVTKRIEITRKVHQIAEDVLPLTCARFRFDFSRLGSSSPIFLPTNRSLPRGKYSDGYRPVALGVGQQRAQEVPSVKSKVKCHL